MLDGVMNMSEEVHQKGPCYTPKKINSTVKRSQVTMYQGKQVE